ncbi:MAG: DNA polymerase III subunit gamma/tau, partial [Clostridiales bacterium]|nr:DNA polymerase III subunit gamma/tau [Clostridiales bacterium]
VTDTLRRQIKLGRLSHAYLFVGTRGTGKTTCAKILARAVNCQNPEDGEPCNKCASCVGIENGSILDVLEIDAASNNGVSDVRALREEAVYSPASATRRVYIVDEVHMLSTAAFNALLKILEEPPEHLIFILATTELHKVPATILSRCQRFSFKRISAAAIAQRLSLVAGKEGLALSADAAEKLASLADGSMRDGLSLLDQCASDPVIDLPRVLDTIGLAGQSELLRFAGAVAGRDVGAALTTIDGLYKDGKDVASLLNEMASLWRDLLVFKLSADSPLLSGNFSRAELSALSNKLNPERLFSFLDVAREAAFGLSRGMSARLSIEMCIFRMCDERLSDDSSAMLARIAKLENNAQSTMHVGADAPGRPKEPAKKRDAVHEDAGADVPAPVPGSPQEPAAEQPKGESGFWHDILEQLKDDASIYMLLSDESKFQTERQEGTLIIRASNAYFAGQIETKMFSDPLREAAGKVFGREVLIRVEVGGESGGEDKREKLERLSAFDIIKFD